MKNMKNMKNMNNKIVIGLIAGSSSDSLILKLQNLGYIVAAVFGDENEPGNQDADYSLITDLKDTDSIIDFFSYLSTNYILIGTGHILAINLIPKLESAGFITNLNFNVCDLLKDKINFKKKLLELNYLTPDFFEASSYDEYIKQVHKVILPVVVKSHIDKTQPVKVNTLNELNDAVNDVLLTNSKVLIEQYIAGNDCTVAVVRNSEGVRDLGVTYYSKAKEYNLKGFDNAYSTKLSVTLEEQVRLISRELIADVGIPSLVRVDFIIEDQRIYILEVNSVMVTGFTGSAYPFFKARNIDVAKIMVDTALDIFKIDEV